MSKSNNNLSNAGRVLATLSLGVVLHGCSSSDGVSTSVGMQDGASQTMLSRSDFENQMINAPSRGVLWKGNAVMPPQDAYESLYGFEPQSFDRVDIADYCHILITTSTGFDVYLEFGSDVFQEGSFAVKNDRFQYEGALVKGVFSASHRLADSTGDKMLLVTVYNDDLRSIGQVQLQQAFGPLLQAELLHENRTMEFVVGESGVFESTFTTYGKITSITSYADCPS